MVFSLLHMQLPRAADAFFPFFLSGEELINSFLLREKRLLGHKKLVEWKEHCGESGDLNSSCAQAAISPFFHPYHFCRQLSVLLTIRPLDQGPKEGRRGRGTEARTEGHDRERIQGNASSHGCRQWECPGPEQGGKGRGARGRKRDWLETAHCGCLEVLAMGQVNRLGKLPPCGVRKEPMAGRCTTSASAGGRKMNWA